MTEWPSDIIGFIEMGFRGTGTNAGTNEQMEGEGKGRVNVGTEVGKDGQTDVRTNGPKGVDGHRQEGTERGSEGGVRWVNLFRIIALRLGFVEESILRGGAFLYMKALLLTYVVGVLLAPGVGGVV